MGDIERVRVLVVGDSGVGKTSLTWLLRCVGYKWHTLDVCKFKCVLPLCLKCHLFQS